MMATVIKVERLGKKYWIGGRRKQGYTALRDVLTEEAKNLFAGAATRRLQKERKAFWALQDISFEVEQGEVLGVIGPNGAGKSTLLKILSRITEPTTGCVTLHGRVASLLEVGTGFHPELTGRENIYLSGAILGMKRMEIRQQFEEIVAFSGVEPFLDTPVKHYSSGMRVRLGFAVAAHLQPEILLVDEILAVGDAEFQKKCLGKMDEVAKGGRTVLFVSHDLNQIVRLCKSSLFIKNGHLRLIGQTPQVIDFYIGSGSQVTELKDSKFIDSLSCTNENGIYSYDAPIKIRIRTCKIKLSEFIISLSLFTAENKKLFISEYRVNPVEKETNLLATIPGFLLKEGTYTVNLNVKSFETKDIIESNSNCIQFRVIDRPINYYTYPITNLGLIQDPVKWTST